MSAVNGTLTADDSLQATDAEEHHESIWGKALYKFRRDRAGMLGFSIVVLYFVAALGVWLGIWG
ncbi:MAG: hypothetical protein KJN77_05295, partial [Gammaproteobacteria bacterium]|nr:hypothetical protein [Gammaproteobacteria bacterium]